MLVCVPQAAYYIHNMLGGVHQGNSQQWADMKMLQPKDLGGKSGVEDLGTAGTGGTHR
jgi:membrane carboxypeptidase/penicillin-binding protein